MVRVLALCSDLMFGSRMAAALQAAGEQLELLADVASVESRLRAPGEQRPEVLIVDLTADSRDGIELVARLAGGGDGSSSGGDARSGAGAAESPGSSGSGEGESGSLRTLGFYSHVEADVRERAERAGFDLVVPRSRMAREGAALVERLLEGSLPRTGGG